jgi:hypothetical protein
MKEEKMDNPHIEEYVTELEKNYPEMTKEYKKICDELYDLFCKKQSNYGPTNISLGTKCETELEQKHSILGIWFRMNDKIQRLKTMTLMNVKDYVGESIAETMGDIANYCIISLIILRNKWVK